MMKALLAGASLLPFLCAGVAAHAADASSTAGEVSEVIVTGTRQVGVKAEDSAAPIQVVGARSLTLTGSTELAQSLATSVPSLNFQANGGDAAAVNIQAALRGLSPNDTLVLVDGKRRHGTANLAVDGGSPYSGSATTDLSFIPIGAIDHVEVLTDGAAAQYGTDAIAGVINIITKKGFDRNTRCTGGEYYDGQGATRARSRSTRASRSATRAISTSPSKTATTTSASRAAATPASRTPIVLSRRPDLPQLQRDASSRPIRTRTSSTATRSSTSTTALSAPVTSSRRKPKST